MKKTKNYREKEDGRPLVRVLSTAWPAVFESFFISLAGMIDTLMVSSMGSEAVASVGLTTQPKFLGLAVFIAVNVAVSAIVARRKGERDRERANETLAAALLMVLVLGVLISFICVAAADNIIALCGSGPDTHKGAVTYFRIIMGGAIFNIVSMVINSAQRGSGNTKIAMYTNTISSLVNIIGNYLLIGGNFGFPQLGIRGAAIATVIGTVVASIMSICSLIKKDSFLNIRFIIKEKLWKRFSSLKTIIRLGSSVFLEQVLLRIGFMSTAVMAADMGTAAMAAHQVGMNVLSLSFSIGDGMQAAAVALIGQSLGEKNPEQAKKYGWICQKIGLFMAVLLSVFYLFCGRLIYQLFFDEASIVDMGQGISRIIVVIVLFQICQVIFTGALRGAGDVVYTTIASCISVTFVRTIAGYIFCYICGFGIYGIWMGIAADQLCRLVFGSLRFKSGKWMKIKI